MPTLLASIVDGSPQILTSDITLDIPGTSAQADPYTIDGTLPAHLSPYRNGNLPDPTVGGFTENTAPMHAVVDNGYSPHSWHGPLLGQGSIDSVPTAGEMTAVQGPGTENRYGVQLAQGVLSQLLSYQPNQTVGALGYIASLTGRATTGGLGGLA